MSDDAAAGNWTMAWSDNGSISFTANEEGVYLDSFSSLADLLSEYAEIFYIPKTEKPPPETGWVKFHEKVKRESLRRHAHKHPKYRRVPAMRGHRWR